MKKSLTLIAFFLMLNLLTTASLHAQTKPEPAPLSDYSLSFCRKQIWAKSCLNVLLTYRCSQYYLPIYPSRAKRCSDSARSMINYLDYKTVQIINDNKIYKFKIIFTNKLRELINTPAVQEFLSNLAVDLKAAMKDHSPFDLYNYTLKYAKNRDTVILWLGILFQDTTFSTVQVQYLEDLHEAGELSAKEIQVKKLMKETALMLNPKNLVKEDYQTWLKLYPALKGNDLSSYLNSSFYHFYPVALWATHLRKNKQYKIYAALIPFALNSDYEFQSLDPDNWPWRHPDPFEIVPNLHWKMQDLYTGLSASLFGAKQEKLLPSFSKFTTQFAEDPFKTMKSWAYKVR